MAKNTSAVANIIIKNRKNPKDRKTNKNREEKMKKGEKTLNRGEKTCLFLI
jgi:hypothetical protein